MNPNDQTPLPFDLYTNFNKETENTKCHVTLKSENGKVYDKLDVLFDTETHDVDLPSP